MDAWKRCFVSEIICIHLLHNITYWKRMQKRNVFAVVCCDRGKSSPLRGQPSNPRHQFKAEMSKAEVSWLLCIGRLVSKTDNVMHFARLVKQGCVDLVSDLFVYYRLGCEPFVCSWGLHCEQQIGFPKNPSGCDVAFAYIFVQCKQTFNTRCINFRLLIIKCENEVSGKFFKTFFKNPIPRIIKIPLN